MLKKVAKHFVVGKIKKLYMKMISTSALAKERDIDSKELFSRLKENGWIYKKEDKWHLTKVGRLAGGDSKYNPKFGDYVVWPINIDINADVKSLKTINATKIGELFNISSQKVNRYLSDLGWVEKDMGGWIVTPEGVKNGGRQLEAQNGKPYSVWIDTINENTHLKRVVSIGEGKLEEIEVEEKRNSDDFRLKYQADKRTSDGHYVRSRAELLIDNFLYSNGIVHAYERKLNIDEPMFCDFYIPSKKVYIEFWGLEENQQYLERKKKKLELYAKYNFNLIELNDKDIENLDEKLAAKLRKFNIIVD